ncbi:MAG: scyllo-inositol 2-dehydrogenase (NAD(+)) [Chloroflexi bacterium]|nr:scyllo-inositol 2-dehydrogenase (NAD(+)) [Chloroflexota bacterium]
MDPSELTTTTIGVCVIGAGRAGMVHARNYFKDVPGARLVGICDPEAKALQTAGSHLEGIQLFPDSQEVLGRQDVGAVVITSPTFTHHDLVVQAARAGKHVFCEKPMALSVAECDSMIAEIRKAGILFQTGFMRRFDSSFIAAKTMVEEGVIGKPLLVKSMTRGPGLPPEWYFSVKQSNGLLAEVNSHDFDSLFWFMGCAAKKVHAFGANLKNGNLAQRYPDFYDHAVVTLVFEEGRLGMIDGSCPAEYGYDSRCEILGEHGVILVGKMNDEAVVAYTLERGVTAPPSISWRSKFRDAYIAEARHFVESIRTKSQPKVGAEEGRRVVAAVVAANRSLVEGESVEISY